MTRAEALAQAVDIVLAGVADIAGLLDRLDHAGGNARLTAAIRQRLSVASPLARAAVVEPDPALWASACDAALGADIVALWRAAEPLMPRFEVRGDLKRWLREPGLSSQTRALKAALNALPEPDLWRAVAQARAAAGVPLP